MKNFFRSVQFKIIISVIAALVAGAIISAIAHSGDSPIASAIGVVFSPVQRLSLLVTKGLDNASIPFASSKSYEKKVNELEKELEKMREDLVDYEHAKQKIELYESFLNVKEENPDYEVQMGTIIGRDSADMFSSFVLNKGTANGISVNDPVVYGRYLVGVVKSVSPTYCVVKTILDPTVNAAAYEVRTRETGYISTTVELSTSKGLCKLSGLDKSTSVFAGGIVCTSGIGGIYPRDLIVGTVIGVEDEEIENTAYALIQPGVNIDELEDVFVITSFEGQGIIAKVSGE